MTKFPQSLKDTSSRIIRPITPVEGWKNVPIFECGEKLVPMGAFVKPGQTGFSDRIFTDSIYFGGQDSSPYKEGELEGALLTIFAREGIARRLAAAAACLPLGMHLLIYDIYRPLSVQGALYADLYNQWIQKGLSHEDAESQTQRFVSMPSSDLRKPSPHNTGAAVDLTILTFDPVFWPVLNAINALRRDGTLNQQQEAERRREQIMRLHGKPLMMGTVFDAVLPQTATRFYEDRVDKDALFSAQEREVLENRRLLYFIMRRVGFSNYDEEHWHYDCDNQFHSRRTGKGPARYGQAMYNDECKAWEEMRLTYHRAWRQGPSQLRPARSEYQARRLMAYNPGAC